MTTAKIIAHTIMLANNQIWHETFEDSPGRPRTLSAPHTDMLPCALCSEVVLGAMAALQIKKQIETGLTFEQVKNLARANLTALDPDVRKVAEKEIEELLARMSYENGELRFVAL